MRGVCLLLKHRLSFIATPTIDVIPTDVFLFGQFYTTCPSSGVVVEDLQRQTTSRERRPQKIRGRQVQEYLQRVTRNDERSNQKNKKEIHTSKVQNIKDPTEKRHVQWCVALPDRPLRSNHTRCTRCLLCSCTCHPPVSTVLCSKDQPKSDTNMCEQQMKQETENETEDEQKINRR